jgi:hypothetical protein
MKNPKSKYYQIPILDLEIGIYLVILVIFEIGIFLVYQCSGVLRS